MQNAGNERIEQRASFDLIRYANCWEDADILCEALRPRRDSRILSIASAGDNVLALLAEGAEVVAADLSGAQLACLELRCAAFRRLSHPEVLKFLGVLPTDDRLEVYADLEPGLTERTRQYWAEHAAMVANGIIHAGRLEAYFRLFRTRVIPLIHSRQRIDQLLLAKDADARHRFYRGVWNNLRWKALFRLFFSRFVMGRLGRDPEFFRYVEGSIADRVLQRTEYALTVLPTDDNPFLEYILTGNFQRALPRYLREDCFDAVRNGLDRLTLFHGSIEHAGRAYAGRGFDAFNLSDIFEYLSEDLSFQMYRDLLAVANRGARLVYWNTFVPRACPARLADRVTHLEDLSSDLFGRDRAFFYHRLIVDEVAGGPAP